MLGICIPSYKVSKHIKNTVSDLLQNIHGLEAKIVLVDDGCPENSLSHVDTTISSIHKIKIPVNSGVGNATILGFDYLVEQGCTTLVKFDSDGQHQSHHIPDIYFLSEELANKKDSKPFLIKGSRYEALSQGNVPLIRKIGSLFIEPLARGAINYRNLSDVANGMICLSRQSYELLKRRNIIPFENRYLFESSLLANVGLLKYSIYEFAMDRIYHKSIKSSLNEFAIIPSMFLLWLRVYLYRILSNSIGRIGTRTLLLLISISTFISSLLHYFIVIKRINSVGSFVSAGTASLQNFLMVSFIISAMGFFLIDYMKGEGTIKFTTKKF